MLRIFIFLCCFLSGCAMQRSSQARDAQDKMIGMSKEDVFTCMGIPNKKSKIGKTEIWLYKSGDGWSNKTKKPSAGSFSGAIKRTFTLGDEYLDRRYCRISIIIRNNRVRKINYNGPTGGFLTEDEQCAYAIRNCLNPMPPSSLLPAAQPEPHHSAAHKPTVPTHP